MVFLVRLISKRRSIISTVFFVSRSPVGSSNNNNSGSFANARAIVLYNIIYEKERERKIERNEMVGWYEPKRR